VAFPLWLAAAVLHQTKDLDVEQAIFWSRLSQHPGR
jgi:hypothetical protein